MRLSTKHANHAATYNCDLLLLAPAVGGMAYMNTFGQLDAAYYQPAWVFPRVSMHATCTALLQFSRSYAALRQPSQSTSLQQVLSPQSSSSAMTRALAYLGLLS
jgi:hypothetical protein